MSSYIDITEYWKSAHPHLTPASRPLKNKVDTPKTCPKCSHESAVEVVAKVKTIDNEYKLPVLYCSECASYALVCRPGDHFLHEDQKIVSVDARLWSSTPSFLNLEPTTRCNFDCWYCVGRHMEQADIEVERFEKILDQFPGLKTLALVGEGEPLMHKRFFDMVRIARNRGITVGTISNGSTFSRSNIEKLCASGINYISISIDSSQPEQFAASRIGGNLDKVLQNIQALVAYRDDQGLKYPKIGLKGTLFAESIDELPKIVDLAKAHGVEIFEGFQALNPMRTYLPIYPGDKVGKLAEINEVQERIQRDTAYALSQLKPIYAFAEEEGIEIDKNGTPNGLRPGCDEQWIYALQSGDVTPCCQIKEPQSPKWNLAVHTIEEIERDPDYENLRFNLWNGLFPQMCQGCWKTGAAKPPEHSAPPSGGCRVPAPASQASGGMLSRVVRFFR